MRIHLFFTLNPDCQCTSQCILLFCVKILTITCVLLGNTNSSLAIPLLDAVYFISLSVQCLFCRYETDKDVCSLLPWDLSCLFIGPTGTATMAPDINQAWRKCSVLSCRTPKGVTHTHADHKETDCGWWRRWQGQHLCDKALTVSLFSLQPAHPGSC